MKKILTALYIIATLFIGGCEEIDLTEGRVTTTIYYTTRDNKIAYANVDHIISNTYNDGKGVIIINGELKTINGHAFAYYGKSSNLTSITIPNSVTSIEDYAFYGCYSLKEVHIEDGTGTLELGYNSYSSYNTGEGLFHDCPLETLYLGRNLSYYSSQYYGYSPFYDKSSLKTLTIGKEVTSIGSSAFYKCNNLSTVHNYSDLNIVAGSSKYGYVGYYADEVIKY